MQHLLGIKDLSSQDMQDIFEVAGHFKNIINQSVKKVPILRDITIANVFFENSTRTRISFELAEKRLSADVINFSVGSSSAQKGETLLDTVRNILHMKVDVVVIRHGSPGVPHFLAKHVDAHIVNAGDGTHEHPTQALLDAFSLQEAFGGNLSGKKILILGDVIHSRVALSNIYCLLACKAEVMVCAPPTLLPHNIDKLGARVETNAGKALAWCDAVNVLRMQLERQHDYYIPSLREYATFYGLNKSLVDSLPKKIIILHPGPINRGVEVNSDVADSSQSIIFHQVENGVAIRMAVLYLLFKNKSKMT